MLCWQLDTRFGSLRPTTAALGVLAARARRPRGHAAIQAYARSAMSRHWLITQSPRRRQRHALLTRILLHRFARGGAVRLTVIQFGLELRARPHYTRSLGVGCP